MEIKFDSIVATEIWQKVPQLHRWCVVVILFHGGKDSPSCFNLFIYLFSYVIDLWLIIRIENLFQTFTLQTLIL